MSKAFLGSDVVKLDTWNDGKAMQGVRVTMCTGEVHLGLLQSSDDVELVLRIADDVLPLRLSRKSVSRTEAVADVRVPSLSYSTCTKVGLGGLGTHTRRIMYSDSERGATVHGFIGNVDAGRIASLKALIEDVLPSVELMEDDEALEEGLVPCAVPGDVVPQFSIHLASHDFILELPGLKRAALHCDSLNRAPHLYAQQTKYVPLSSVGCTRGVWRYRFAHMPGDEKKATPFSFPAWGDYVAERLEATGGVPRLNELALPLRNHVVESLWTRRARREHELFEQVRQAKSTVEHATRDMHNLVSEKYVMSVLLGAHRAEMKCGALFATEISVIDEQLAACRHAADAAEAVEARARTALSALYETELPPRGREKSTYYVVKPLSEEQSVDAINAFHLYYYGGHLLDAEQSEIVRTKLQHLPQTTGHFVHWTSSYEHTDRNLGEGKLTRYKVDDLASLPASSRNKLCVGQDGKVYGRGGQGYKGRFRKANAYNPKRQLVRTDDHEESLRRRPRAL